MLTSAVLAAAVAYLTGTYTVPPPRALLDILYNETKQKLEGQIQDPFVFLFDSIVNDNKSIC